jgi:hypothetical protein
MAHATSVPTEELNPPSYNPTYEDEGQADIPFATAELKIPVAAHHGQPNVVDQMMHG